MAKTVYIGVAFDTKQLVTGADIATQTIKRFGVVVNDASGNVRNSSVPALDAYTKATINAEKAMRQTTSAVVPLKVAKAELTKQTQALQAAMRAQVTTEAGMQAQAKAIAAATRDQAAAQKLYDQSLRDSGKSINEHSFSLGGLAKGALAAGAAYLSFHAVLGVGRSLIDISDKYTMLEGRLKLVTSGSAELASVQASLFDISQKTRVSTQDTSNLYIKLAQSTQGLGISQKQLLSFTESLNKALVVSGASTEEGANAMRQFGQSLAGGIMRGEEYNSVMESTPRVMKMIEDGLGMTRGEMRKFMLDGKLTTEMLVEGLAKGAAKVDEEFAGMGTTVGQAMTELKNAYESVINDANKASGGTASLAGSIESLARTVEQNKGGIISAFEAIANSIGWAVDRFAAFGNAYKLNQLYQTGKISLWDYATAGPDKAKQFIAKQGSPGNTVGDETGMQMAIAARAAAPAIKEVTKAIHAHTAAAQNHTKASSSGATAASKAASAAEKQAKETDRLREKYEDIIAKTSPVAKLQEEYADKLATVAKAHKELNISLEKQTEDLALLAKQHEDSLKKPFEQIAKQFEKKTALDEYTSALSKINDNLADAAKGEKDRAVQIKAAEEATVAVVAAMQEELKQKGISVRITKQNASEIDKAYTQHEASVRSISDVLQSTGNTAGLSSGFISNMTDALDEFNKGAALGGKTIKGLASAMQAIGSQFGGQVGEALVGMGVGLKVLTTELDTSGMTGEQAQRVKDLQQVSGYTAIANNFGNLIGGNAGKSISGASSGASMGAAIGSIIPGVGTIAGAVVGGIGGLFGSLFGGPSKEDIALAQQKSQTGSQRLATLAGSGSKGAQDIYAQLEYNPDKITSYFYAKENNYNESILKNLENLQKISDAVNSFASPTIAKTLNEIDFRYKSLAVTIGDTADLQLAKQNELIVALTGISADSVSAILESVVTSVDASDVGAAFSAKLTEAIATSIRQMEITTFISSAVMPALQPIMGVLATQLASGQDTSGSFANINSVLNNLTPSITSFANSLTAQGIAGYTATKAANDYAAATKERYGLETQLLTLQGDTAALRARELVLIAPSNRAIQEQIWAMQDQAQAATDSANALKSVSASLNNLVDAGAKLESYRMTLFAGSANSMVSLQVQKDLISQLAVKALSSDYNTRLSAINDLQSSVGSAVSSAKNYYADPMELNREISRQSNLLAEVVSKQKEVTLADLKESVDALNETITTVVGNGNATAEDIKTILKDFQIDGVMITT